MSDFSDTKPMNLYEAAIGERNQDYYIEKFEAFDQRGPGLKPSWNWAAFAFAGFWALYRKMYVWFFGWWAWATVLTIILLVPNQEIHQLITGMSVVLWIGFAVFANSLYHSKINARIFSVSHTTTDVARVTSRLSTKSGVNRWVAFLVGGIPILGIVLAVALPAMQGKTKVHNPSNMSGAFGENDNPAPSQLDPNTARPVQAPDWDRGTFTQPSPQPKPSEAEEFLGKEQKKTGLAPLSGDRELLRSQGIGGSQELSDVASWGESQLIGRSLEGSDLIKAHSFVLMWQRQITKKMQISPERALFLAYSIVVSNFDGTGALCRPDIKNHDGIEDMPGDEFKTYPECFKKQ